jgi:hypothetical protein
MSHAADVKAKYTGSKQCGSKFKGSFENGLTNKCYTCPSGYKHAWWRNITNKKSCYKKKPKKHSKAKYKGREGCIGKKNFEYAPKGKCYQCPTGFKRTNFVANPAKTKVCSLIKTKASKSMKAKLKAELNDPNSPFQTIRNVVGSTPPTPRFQSAPVKVYSNRPVIYVEQSEQDKDRINQLKQLVDENKADNEPYVTATASFFTGGSVIFGYAESHGFSMTLDENDTYECRKFTAKIWSGGLQAGFDHGQTLGVHSVKIGDIDGVARGVVGSLTVFDGALTWGGGGTNYEVAFPRENDTGISIAGVAAVIDAGIAGTDVFTDQATNTVNCESLTWGKDFDKVNGYSVPN